METFFFQNESFSAAFGSILLFSSKKIIRCSTFLIFGKLSANQNMSRKLSANQDMFWNISANRNLWMSRERVCVDKRLLEKMVLTGYRWFALPSARATRSSPGRIEESDQGPIPRPFTSRARHLLAAPRSLVAFAWVSESPPRELQPSGVNIPLVAMGTPEGTRVSAHTVIAVSAHSYTLDPRPNSFNCKCWTTSPWRAYVRNTLAML